MRPWGIIALCSLLVACATHEPVTLDTLATHRLEHPNRAVVLGTVDVIQDDGVKLQGMLTFKSHTIRHGDPEFAALQEMTLSSPVTTKEAVSSQMTFTLKNFILIPPVTYAVDSVRAPSFMRPIAGWDSTVPPVSITFNQGEIVYIGHIIFEKHGNIYTIRTEDDLNGFARDYPIPATWQGHIVKRLLQLPATISDK